MARDRPQLSITLPRNFTFHYREGQEPRTPEQELPAPVPQSPHAYRIKRRPRPSVSSVTYDHNRDVRSPQDIPIPTIEAPLSVEPLRPLFQQRATEPAEGYLAPILSTRRFMTLPRTPSAQTTTLDGTWSSSKHIDLGESIARPMSTCSILSDSSDDSVGSLSSHPSQGGSCTSPESDAPDPFGSFPVKRGKKSSQSPMVMDKKPAGLCHVSKQPIVRWTSDMDKHIWSTYLIYLQDPTVTPFKMLPGTAPPLGVCHRVAREARRTWHGGRTTSGKPFDVAALRNANDDAHAVKAGDSPETIKAGRSGSNTPTGLAVPRLPAWPKSGSSTRRRLRELCKQKPTIAPHYQRLLQNRSPSPFSSSSPARSQPSRACSPFGHHRQYTPFNTRDIQLSLTTSTSATMQPDGPLAQLATKSSTHTQSNQVDSDSREWFNDPIVPWASPTAIPSDLGFSMGVPDEVMETPHLGSPFGFHTWGPSRSRQQIRPSTPRTQFHDTATIGPSLRSPVRFHDTFPYPSVLKRRAQHNLEDELSPGGSNTRMTLLEDLFGGPSESRHRRVRSRGFSLGDVNANGGRLESMFTPPTGVDQMTSPENVGVPMESDDLRPPSMAESVKRLGSPFCGFGPRPSRGSSRHMASASLSAYDPNSFSSIDQRLVQTDFDDVFKKRLAG